MNNMNDMNVCNQLKINPSSFEGFELPLTVQDAIIFFRSEININNIPEHIRNVIELLDTGRISTDDEIIFHSRKQWLVTKIRHQLNRNEKLMKLKLDCIINIFQYCIDEYDIYKTMDNSFIRICNQKIQEVLVLNSDIYNYNYRKAINLAYTLRQLMDRDSLL